MSTDGNVYDWSAFRDDSGQIYYHNAKTDVTSWEPPDTQGFNPIDDDDNDDDDDANADGVNDSGNRNERDVGEIVASSSPIEEPEGGNEGFANWVEYKNDDGSSYFFNTKTEETSWEKPDGFVSTPTTFEETMGDDDGYDKTSPIRPTSPIYDGQDDDNDHGTAHPVQSGSDWVEYKDDEGKSYFYNEKTQENVWERPSDFKSIDDDSEKLDQTDLSPIRQESPLDMSLDENDVTDATPEVEEKIEEEVIDPVVKRLNEAKEALAQPDAIMETGAFRSLVEVIKSDQGNPKSAIQSLSESARGQTAVCGLLSRWLADLKSQTASTSNSTPEVIDKNFQKAVNEIRETTQEVVNRIAKENFSREAGDTILALSKSEAAFLEDMMNSNRWRKLLIDLSATNKDSALLMYCLQAISKRGYHREIARRINQSEHFPVFNAMLASELAVIGKISVSACYDHDTSISLNELVGDLRRTCTSAAYTYMYALEVLRFQVQKANDDSSKMTEKDRLLYARIIRKWERLVEIFQEDMIDPSTVVASGSNNNPLTLKRRIDVACTVSDLHQRQRRRLRLGCDDAEGQSTTTDSMKGCSYDRKASIESAILTFLRRYGSGSQIDDTVVDKMLPSVEESNEAKFIGNLLVKYPIAIKALLGYLYKPRQRPSSPMLRNKCARLISLSVLSAEETCISEAKKIDSKTEELEINETELTRSLVEGCQLCEQLEHVVSFIVTADTANIKGLTVSPGEQLCSLAIKWAPVSQGVAMWSREITRGVEFVNSASYASISPNIMSLVRIVYSRHPFTRHDVSDVAFQFLKHNNSEIVYQTMNSLKEQSLRLLIYLCMKGEAPNILNQITKLLKDPGKSPLDASLIRYFISGLLEVVSPPFSVPFIRSLLTLFKSPASIEAVKTSYFDEQSKNRLKSIINYLKTRTTRRLGERPLAKEDASLVNSILAIYHPTD